MDETNLRETFIMKQKSQERKAALLLTDMVNFTNRTAHMSPIKVCDFLIEYRQRLKSQIMKNEDGAQYFEHAAGDATASVFEKKDSERDDEKSIRALRAALRITLEIAKNNIPSTRIGLFSGKVIKARFDNQIFRFGNSFSAANRLQELCGFFNAPLLMDRDIARAQREEKAYITSIGKITPKSFTHPVHIFTTHKPGIDPFPLDVDEKKLFQYINIKNEAMEFFCGNALREIKPNFPIASEKLYQAASLFKEITGHNDISSERVLDYIREHSFPTENFLSHGMKIEGKRGNRALGVRLLKLSQEFLKAVDGEFYEMLILNTDWGNCFKLEWKEKGEVIIEKGAEPDGVYFLSKGEVHIFNGEKVIAVLKEGNIFGEMAYFSVQGTRNATVIAFSDSVLHKISGKDFMKFPAIKNLFERIAQKRLFQQQKENIEPWALTLTETDPPLLL